MIQKYSIYKITVVILISICIITLAMLNQPDINASMRNSLRANDLQNYTNAIDKYLSIQNDKGSKRRLNDFPGYDKLLSNVVTNRGGACPNAINGINLTNINGRFELKQGGSDSFDLSILKYEGILTELMHDPSGNNYYTCIDKIHDYQLVLYSPIHENKEINIALPVGYPLQTSDLPIGLSMP